MYLRKYNSMFSLIDIECRRPSPGLFDQLLGKAEIDLLINMLNIKRD